MSIQSRSSKAKAHTAHTNTHTHSFNSQYFMITGISQYCNVKPFWILMHVASQNWKTVWSWPT